MVALEDAVLALDFDLAAAARLARWENGGENSNAQFENASGGASRQERARELFW